MLAESGDRGPELEIILAKCGYKGYSRDGDEEQMFGDSKVLSKYWGHSKFKLLVGEDNRNSEVGDSGPFVCEVGKSLISWLL